MYDRLVNSDIGDTPESFDVSRHTWARFYRETEDQWEKGPGRDNLPPERFFSEIEQTLERDDARDIKSIIYQSTGDSDATPKTKKITIVNRGRMQVVTKIDITYDTDTKKNVPITFIGIITLGNDVSACHYGLKDYYAINRLRTLEAAQYTDDPEYDKKRATFPKQYGVTETPGGHMLQYSEFIQGSYEVNLKVWKRKNGKRKYTYHRIVANGYTHNAGGYEILSRRESRKIMGNIVRHQLTTAIRCHTVIAPSFEAGDYLYDENNAKAILHTEPDRDHDEESDIWRKLNKKYRFPISALGVSKKVYYAASQILHMLTSQEHNLYPLKDGESDDDLFYVYEIPTIVEAIAELAKQPNILTLEEWNQVLDLICKWIEFIFTHIDTKNPSYIERHLVSLFPTLKDRIPRLYVSMRLALRANTFSPTHPPSYHPQSAST